MATAIAFNVFSLIPAFLIKNHPVPKCGVNTGFDNPVGRAEDGYMKTLRQFSVVLAVGVLTAGAAVAQDKNSAAHQGTLSSTNVSSPFSLQLPASPQITVGHNWQASGLAVDLVKPQQTWELFNPCVPATVGARPEPVVPAPVDVRVPAGNDNLAVHDANFVLLKLSFP